MIVRDAVEADVAAMAAIYNEVITTSDAIWLDEPVTLEKHLAWFQARQDDDVFLVAEADDGSLAGYAGFSGFRSLAGYRLTVEHTVMIQHDHRGQGVGDRLMVDLIDRARHQGREVMVAAIDAGNSGSSRFHERLGFRQVGLMPGVGRKHGRPTDLLLMQLDL